MTHETTETVYDMIATGIDTAVENAGPDGEALFLAKLALALARDLNNPDRVAELVDLALSDLVIADL
jgi:hypothetical protein